MGGLTNLPDDPVEALRAFIAECDRKKAVALAEIAKWEPQSGPGRLWLEYDDLFDSALALGQQYPTGFPTIDRMTDGGLALGTVTIVQGKAGIGKTLVATQIARALAPRCAVAALFQDGGLRLSRVQIGQQLGQDRRKMRRPDEEARQEAVRAMARAAVFWKFMQPISRRATVETLATDFDKLAPPELPRVWLMDSAQVLRSEKAMNQKDRRIKVSDTMWLIHDLAVEMNAIAIVISHVSRGSYASKDKEKRTEDLAAGAETADIERTAELLLHIDGNPKQQMEIRCKKNRYTGEEFTVHCRVDFPTATFHELDTAAVEQDEEQKFESELHGAKKAVLTALQKEDGLSGRQVIAAVLLRAVLVYAALKSLAKDGAIRCDKGPRNSMVWRVIR